MYSIFKLCRVLFNFDSLDENTLSVKRDEILEVLKMEDESKNNQWWLVKNQQFLIAYVPSSYLILTGSN